MVHRKYHIFLSWLLRHGILEKKLHMRDDGYVAVTDILLLQEMNTITRDDICQIVKTDSKQRFSMIIENEIEMIRANQGHSKKVGELIDETKLLQQISEPMQPCIHGTYRKHLDSIFKDGLKPMNRSFIHFGQSISSGIRSDADIYIYIDMKHAMDDEMKFFLSKNNVILTKGLNGCIDKKYFEKYVSLT